MFKKEKHKKRICYTRLSSEGRDFQTSSSVNPISGGDILSSIDWLFEREGKVVVERINDEEIHLTSLRSIQDDSTDEKLDDIKDMIRRHLNTPDYIIESTFPMRRHYETIGRLTDKEKEALKSALSVIYLNDSSDYLNGLWDVVRAIIGDKLDDEDFSAKDMLHALDPELGK